MIYKIGFSQLLIGLTLIIFIACKTRSKTSETPSQNRSNDLDSLFVSIDRSPCFGMCPTYLVNIYKSGYAIYKGKMAVARIGTYEAHFLKEQLKLFSNAAIENRVDH